MADFVMHGQEKSFVEIELYNPVRNIIIRRDFKRASKNGSEWKLNGKKSSEKEVKEKVASLHIRVENLCTFLPQDKVGDFSGYNPKQILVETCKAVDEKELYDVYQQLIKDEAENVGKVAKQTVRSCCDYICT